MSEESSRHAQAHLGRLGVEVLTDAMVAQVHAQHLELKDGSMLQSGTIVWTAGVQGDPQTLGFGLSSERGRALVENSLQARGHDRIFAVGDLARTPENPAPMVAPAAMQQGKHVARNITRALAGRGLLPFRYKDPGSMCALGRNNAVAEVFGLKLRGLLAWILWVFVHVGLEPRHL